MEPLLMKFIFDLAFKSRQRLSRLSLFQGCTPIRGVKYRVQKVVDRNLYPRKDNQFPAHIFPPLVLANEVVRWPERANLIMSNVEGGKQNKV